MFPFTFLDFSDAILRVTVLVVKWRGTKETSVVILLSKLVPVIIHFVAQIEKVFVISIYVSNCKEEVYFHSTPFILFMWWFEGHTER